MAAQNIRIEIVPFPEPDEPDEAASTEPEAIEDDLTESPSAEADVTEPDAADEEAVEQERAEEEPAPARSGLTPIEPVDTEPIDTEPVDAEPIDAEPIAETEPEPDESEAAVPEAELDEVEPDETTAEPEAQLDAPEPEAESELESPESIEDAAPEPEAEDSDPDVSEIEATLDEPDTEPGAEAEPEPDLEAPEAAAPEFVPTPGARAARRRAAQAVPSTATPGTAESAPVEHDDSALRGTSISGRLLFMTLGTVTFVALVVLTSVWGVARVADAGREIAAIADAKESARVVLAELDSVQAGPDDAATRRLASLSADAADAARPWVADDIVIAAATAVDEYVADRSDDTYDAATAAGARLDAALRERQADAVDHSESVRTTAIALVLVLFALGSIALVVLGRVIGRSVVAPIRSLGRNLRRFGDGDLASRSAIAGDEVGTLARSFNVMAESVSERVLRLNAIAERDAQLRMVGDALDLADRETDVYRILEQALTILTPDNPGELLVNEPTSPRLWQVSTNPSAGPGGCPVETAEACPAMRRAQAMVFDGPSAINACPQLRNHESPCSAACVPVGVNGHLLGVVHVTAPEHEPPDAEVVEQLVTLAGQVGVRVGAQRTLETTRLQASTDGLTGLANRRMLEARLGDLLRGGVSFALAVADVDRFKQLNDTYGHELGDRALQLFAKVLEDNVRGHDVVARYGGEEFVLVYPELTVKKAMEVIERIRLALERAIDAAGLPPFTCSFGVTHSSSADTVDGIIRIADAGLFQAKDLGRNRVVFADLDLAAEVFGAAGAPAIIDLTDPVEAPADDTDEVPVEEDATS